MPGVCSRFRLGQEHLAKVTHEMWWAGSQIVVIADVIRPVLDLFVALNVSACKLIVLGLHHKGRTTEK